MVEHPVADAGGHEHRTPAPISRRPSGARPARWKLALPWVVTLGLLAYLGWSHDLRAVWQALREVRVDWALGLWVLTIVGTFWLDTACLTVLFTRLNRPVRFRELLPVKGASYFLNILNYNAAAGAIAWFLRKSRGVPFLEAASSMLFLSIVDLLVLNVFVSAGLLLGAPALPDDGLRMLVGANLAIYAAYFGSMSYWNLGFNYFVLARLRPLAIFSSFRKAVVGTHLTLFGMRAVFILAYVVMQYLSLHLFGIDVPFREVMVYNAIITFIGTIPISVAGFGTTQLAMLSLYGAYGTEAQILAYSTSILVLFAVARALIGYSYLRTVSRQLGWTPGAEASAPPDAPSAG